MMTRSDRETLLQVCRMRARVAKADAAHVAAQRKADFEAQLAREYSYDDDQVWRKAHALAQDAATEAQGEIARRSAELGIPKTFAPKIQLGWWDRGENACRERRAELTRVAYRKIDELEKAAKLQIERASVEIQTKLVADGLESADAKAFLESMPTAAQLMPAVTVAEAQKELPGFNSDIHDDEIETDE